MKDTSIQQLLEGARIATSDQVVNNEFLTKTQDEVNRLQALQEAQVQPRPTRENG
jgi:hypothetical protein